MTTVVSPIVHQTAEALALGVQESQLPKNYIAAAKEYNAGRGVSQTQQAPIQTQMPQTQMPQAPPVTGTPYGNYQQPNYQPQQPVAPQAPILGFALPDIATDTGAQVAPPTVAAPDPVLAEMQATLKAMNAKMEAQEAKAQQELNTLLLKQREDQYAGKLAELTAKLQASDPAMSAAVTQEIIELGRAFAQQGAVGTPAVAQVVAPVGATPPAGTPAVEQQSYDRAIATIETLVPNFSKHIQTPFFMEFMSQKIPYSTRDIGAEFVDAITNNNAPALLEIAKGFATAFYAHAQNPQQPSPPPAQVRAQGYAARFPQNTAPVQAGQAFTQNIRENVNNGSMSRLETLLVLQAKNEAQKKHVASSFL